MSTTAHALGSWRSTPTRQSIVDFVASVTDPASSHFVPPPERIATFDNDGTLWTEKPLPTQADFLLRRVGAMAAADPSLTARQPWKAVAAHDYAWLGDAITKHYHGDDRDLMEMAAGLLAAYEGYSIEEFEVLARDFLQTQQHPTLKRPYVDCAFKPMRELLQYLSDHQFVCYIATGGGRDFMRPISEAVYGIPPDRVIGSSVALEFTEVDGVTRIVHTAKLDLFDDGPAKPVRIWSRVGRRPILAAGNANGDVPMLAFAGGPNRLALRLLIDHDDADREAAYTAGAEDALARARADNWTTVSVKDDWAVVFND